MASPYPPGRPSARRPPTTAGAYRIVDKATNRPLYIGETSNLRRRMGEHRRTGLFDPMRHYFVWKAAAPSASVAARRRAEKTQIAKHAPPLNRRGGGAGRIPLG